MTGLMEHSSLAVFCDFENVALGVRDARYDKFDINKVLERLLLKGSIVVKKAYCDWGRYKDFRPAMHEASFELIEIPHLRQAGKNSADIRMVVDALDLCYTKTHVNVFVIISGDSDFSPLVSKLRENNKFVIGVGVKNSTSDLLIANCDEFIYYDDLVRKSNKPKPKPKPKPNAARKTMPAKPAPKPKTVKTAAKAKSSQVENAAKTEKADKADKANKANKPDKPDKPDKTAEDEKMEKRVLQVLDLLVETLEALIEERGAGEKVWASMVKQAIKRRRPGFHESYYGFRSFSSLLEEATARGYLEIELDEKSGSYVLSPAKES